MPGRTQFCCWSTTVDQCHKCTGWGVEVRGCIGNFSGNTLLLWATGLKRKHWKRFKGLKATLSDICLVKIDLNAGVTYLALASFETDRRTEQV